MKVKYKCLISCNGDIEEFVKMINDYFYSTGYKIEGNFLINKNMAQDVLDRMKVEFKNNRWRLLRQVNY